MIRVHLFINWASVLIICRWFETHLTGCINIKGCSLKCDFITCCISTFALLFYLYDCSSKYRKLWILMILGTVTTGSWSVVAWQSEVLCTVVSWQDADVRVHAEWYQSRSFLYSEVLYKKVKLFFRSNRASQTNSQF